MIPVWDVLIPSGMPLLLGSPRGEKRHVSSRGRHQFKSLSSSSHFTDSFLPSLWFHRFPQISKYIFISSVLYTTRNSFKFTLVQLSGPTCSLKFKVFLQFFLPLECFQLSCCWVTKSSCPTAWDPMDCSTPGFPVLHYLPEFVQTHVHWVDDAIQPSHPLSSLCPLLLLPSIFPSIRVFAHESVLRIRWPKYWSPSTSPSNEYSGLISFRMDCLDLLAVQGTLKSLLQHHSSKASILRHSAFLYSCCFSVAKSSRPVLCDCMNCSTLGFPVLHYLPVHFSRSVTFDSLQPHGLQHARLPCLSPTPGACSNSCPLNQWCHPTISCSLTPFSSCPQYFPVSVFSIESYIVRFLCFYLYAILGVCCPFQPFWFFSFNL